MLKTIISDRSNQMWFTLIRYNRDKIQYLKIMIKGA